MRRTGIVWLAMVLALLAAAAPAGAAEETWADDSGQGVEFTRDITRTHVPRFHDMRPTSFTCSNGLGYDDPLVVISAGDASGNGLPIAIGPDGSFSYDGPATYNAGRATLSVQGRFDGDRATGTLHWHATRTSDDGTTCEGDSAMVSWSAHCSASCGGVSAGDLTVTMKGKPLIGQWALVDVAVSSDGAARVAAFAHHKGSRACGTFAEEDATAAQKGRHGPVERLGEAQLPGPGSYVFHGKYVPDQFGHRDRICAYLTEAPAGDTVLASGEARPKIGFALPWSGVWGPQMETTILVTGVYGFQTPDRQRPRGSAPGFNVLGTWGCDGGLQRTNKLAGRRWWIGAYRLGNLGTPLHPHADGSFAYHGPANPDFGANYDGPIPKRWPSRTMRVDLTGRFFAGHGARGAGVVNRARARLSVRVGGRRCSTHFSVRGSGEAGDLPAATDKRYSGTITAA